MVTGLSISCNIIFFFLAVIYSNTQSANYKKQKMFSLLLSNKKCKMSHQPINSTVYVYELHVHHRLINSHVQLHGLNVATSQGGYKNTGQKNHSLWLINPTHCCWGHLLTPHPELLCNQSSLFRILQFSTPGDIPVLCNQDSTHTSLGKSNRTLGIHWKWEVSSRHY